MCWLVFIGYIKFIDFIPKLNTDIYFQINKIVK